MKLSSCWVNTRRTSFISAVSTVFEHLFFFLTLWPANLDLTIFIFNSEPNSCLTGKIFYLPGSHKNSYEKMYYLRLNSCLISSQVSVERNLQLLFCVFVHIYSPNMRMVKFSKIIWCQYSSVLRVCVCVCACVFAYLDENKWNILLASIDLSPKSKWAANLMWLQVWLCYISHKLFGKGNIVCVCCTHLSFWIP